MADKAQTDKLTDVARLLEFAAEPNKGTVTRTSTPNRVRLRKFEESPDKERKNEGDVPVNPEDFPQTTILQAKDSLYRLEHSDGWLDDEVCFVQLPTLIGADHECKNRTVEQILVDTRQAWKGDQMLLHEHVMSH